MARIYQTRSWHDQLSPSMEELELLALEAYAHLPEQFRSLTGEIVIQLAEFPTDEIMDDLSLETPFDLLGLFEGRGIAERWNPQTGEGPNRVTLYRRAILDYWAENDETLGSGDEKLPARHAAMPDEVDIPVDTLGAAVEPFGEAAFDLRNLMAQRRNGPLRHGRECHDVQLFEVCSCYVLIDSRADPKSQAGPAREFIPRRHS